MAYVASPTSDLAKRTKLTIQDLAGHRLLLAKHDCAYRMKLEQLIMAARVDTAAVVHGNEPQAPSTQSSRPMVPTSPNATLLLAHAPSIAAATRHG